MKGFHSILNPHISYWDGGFPAEMEVFLARREDGHLRKF
jgi:hypothetical protein